MSIIKPQEGYQLQALSSNADIVIGGGAAGAGKTWTLLADAVRGAHVKDYGAVIFRRTYTQIKSQGGLWDASNKFYGLLENNKPIESKLTWYFNNGLSKIKFSNLEYAKNIYDWQGSEIPFIGFDELTHFTKKMFFYLLSRNRSTCGFSPVVRATCNPDPDSWVRMLIDWWIGKDGLPIEERSGVVRYFMIHEDNYIWGDSREEVIEKSGDILNELLFKAKEKGNDIKVQDFIKSITFISGSVFENKELLKKDPAYLGNLNSQSSEEKNRLLYGNWNVKISKSDIYNFNAFMDIFSNEHVRQASLFAKKVITTDIAMKGSDKFVVFVWQGKMLIDFLIMAKSKGNEVINAIKGLAIKHGVRFSNIIFDNDGVGQFVDGFIPNAVEFKNGGTPVNRENYANLKTQCYYKSGEAVERGEYFIPEEVGKRPYDDKMSLMERLMFERKAIKRDKTEHDGKLRILGKHEMKTYIDNESPDLMDCFKMREYQDLRPKSVSVTYS